MQRIVISGGPASGKTSILQTLSAKGYFIFPEVARKVIKEQVNICSRKVPWDDISGFTKLVLKGQIADFENTSASVSFFDRGIPDLIAYMNHGNQPLFPELTKATISFKYNHIFLLPPWEDIYETDKERKEDFENSILIFEQLEKIYKKLNYSPILVPKLPIVQRSEFILTHING
jgi:predicted ATPase